MKIWRARTFMPVNKAKIFVMAHLDTYTVRGHTRERFKYEMEPFTVFLFFICQSQPTVQGYV